MSEVMGAEFLVLAYLTLYNPNNKASIVSVGVDMVQTLQNIVTSKQSTH